MQIPASYIYICFYIIYIIPNIFNLIHNRIITNLHESSLLKKHDTIHSPTKKKHGHLALFFQQQKKEKKNLSPPF